jgi:type IV pilus assembly protein PilB
MASRKIGQILVDLGYLSEDQLWDVLNEQKSRPEMVLGQVAITMGFVTESQVDQAVAEQLGMQVVNLSDLTIASQVLDMVPETMATVYKIVPISFRNDVLTVAMADPQNIAALDDLRNMLNVEVKGAVSNERDVRAAIDRLYSDKQASIEDVVAELEKDQQLQRAASAVMSEHSIDLESIEELADAAPVRKLLNMVLLLAIKDKASDIHFEPFEDEFKMRYRVDGVLYEMVPPPRHLSMAIATRIKVMSNLDIAERRLPQDGRIELNVGGNPVDMRVSVLPTMFGESVVLRVLDRTVVQLDLNKIGMPAETLARYREVFHKPNGIILVTGPTGSGKTTTLYSTLNELNDISVKIITTEDPVEYDLDGIVQVQINDEIGVTFANCLRSILRQDPDKILVGEIRDLETAEIAVQSSLTGHIVFSTLHTNDAPSTITRLRDMGIPTFLITATVEAILAQRLVRRICADCRTEFEPSPEMLMELNLKPADVVSKTFYYGRGCERCNNTGYRGRTGIYELMVMNDDVRDLIMNNASTDQLRVAARRSGMMSLREAGLRAIYEGSTTIDEVVRETVVEEEAQ